MRARQERNTLIFELEGHLDFETTQRFQQTCATVIEESSAEYVVFNLEKLRFVGSSGIHQFINVLKDFNSSANQPRLCGASSEFERVLRAYQATRRPFFIFEKISDAIASFESEEPVPKPIKKPATSPNRKKRRTH